MTSKGIRLSKPGTRHLTVIAALLAMIGPFSIDAYLPSFPDIEMEFGISRAMLSQSLAVYLLAFAVSTLAWGPLADRFGRRLVILISMTFCKGIAGLRQRNITQTFPCPDTVHVAVLWRLVSLYRRRAHGHLQLPRSR